MDFQSATPAVVTAIRQRDLLNAWLHVYAREQRLPRVSEYEPGRLKEEADDLVYYAVDTAQWPPILTIQSEGTRMSTAYGQSGKGRRLDEYVGPRLVQKQKYSDRLRSSFELAQWAAMVSVLAGSVT